MDRMHGTGATFPEDVQDFQLGIGWMAGACSAWRHGILQMCPESGDFAHRRDSPKYRQNASYFVGKQQTAVARQTCL